MALGLGIIALGVVLLLFLSNTLDHRAFAPVPKLPDVKQAQPQNGADPNGTQPNLANQQLTPEQLQQLAVQSAQAQQDLQRLANSLSDDSATKQAAQDIQNGNYNAAAQDLQQVASNLDQVSPDARQNIAGDLQQAASQNTSGNQPLTDAEKNASAALQQGSGNDASQSVRNLANQVQQTGSQVDLAAGPLQRHPGCAAAREWRSVGAEQGQQDQQGQQGQQGQAGSTGTAGTARATGAAGCQRRAAKRPGSEQQQPERSRCGARPARSLSGGRSDPGAESRHDGQPAAAHRATNRPGPTAPRRHRQPAEPRTTPRAAVATPPNPARRAMSVRRARMPTASRGTAAMSCRDTSRSRGRSRKAED